MAEMLLGLAMLLVISSLFPLGIRILLDERIYDEGIWRMEWEVFGSQAKKEVREVDEIYVGPDWIVMKKAGKTVLYEKYGNSLRRRVDNEGHEILLQNISSIRFVEYEGGVEVVVLNESGARYSLRIHYFISI